MYITIGFWVVMALVFYCILPRRYEVSSTHLTIVVGWRLRLALNTIQSAEHVVDNPCRYAGTAKVSFSPDPWKLVYVKRAAGWWDYTLSPQDPHAFARALNSAIAAQVQRVPGVYVRSNPASY